MDDLIEAGVCPECRQPTLVPRGIRLEKEEKLCNECWMRWFYSCEGTPQVGTICEEEM